MSHRRKKSAENKLIFCCAGDNIEYPEDIYCGEYSSDEEDVERDTSETMYTGTPILPARRLFSHSDDSPIDLLHLKEYQEFIFFTVKERLTAEPEKFQDFVNQSRDYGNGTITAPVYWAKLVHYFSENGATYFLPKVARMIEDGDKRKELLNAPQALAELEVDATEMNALKDHFDKHSHQRNSAEAPQIYMKEFRKAVRVLAHTIPDHEYEPPSSRDLNHAFREADVNKSRSIDFEEFLSLYVKIKKGDLYTGATGSSNTWAKMLHGRIKRDDARASLDFSRNPSPH